MIVAGKAFIEFERARSDGYIFVVYKSEFRLNIWNMSEYNLEYRIRYFIPSSKAIIYNGATKVIILYEFDR